ncbi:MAG TPA: GyrI-like domain-containing protein [Bacteroidales bacterium]|nr:GyrI-like domain-containing protein [Bacteroidales bacterium]HSA44517.1 GyrI-like domain-containing protein [Bacteroidales bacterium]
MTPSPQTGDIYKARINKVLDYIDRNYEKQFTLGELAGVANFSRFHFHRIFQALMHETPFQFIVRVRLEKAAYLMAAGRRESITAIAMTVGFTDIAVFSRNFRKHFGISATRYLKEKCRSGNLSQTDRNMQQALPAPSMYFCPESQTLQWRTNMKMNKSVEVRELPKMTLAYIRHIGPYKGNEKLFESLWNRLFTWAGPRGLIGGPGFTALVVYHDDPNVTTEDKLRMSVSITVPPDTRVDGEVGKMELEAALYVIARFEVGADEFQQAWEWVYGQWFPASGYQPDDKPCFEMYPEEPRDGKFIVDICVPVKAL